MNMPLKIIDVDGTAAVVLPDALLARLRVSPGDTLYASDAAEGVTLTATDIGLAAKMAIAERIMREDRDILSVLAQ